MSFINYLTFIGCLASIIGVLVAFIFQSRSRREKRLVYEVSDAVPIATAISPDASSNLHVVLRRNEKEEEIDCAFVRYLRIVNLGKVSIRRSDLVGTDALRVSLQGVRALSISVGEVTNKANNFSITEDLEQKTGARIEFDFLDQNDGALLSILTEGGGGSVSLEGSVIEMPAGIQEATATATTSWLARTLWSAAALITLLILALPFRLFYLVTGSYANSWLLLLPVASIGWAALAAIFAARFIWYRSRASFPTELIFPDWFRSLSVYHSGMAFKRIDLQEIRSNLREKHQESFQNSTVIP